MKNPNPPGAAQSRALPVGHELALTETCFFSYRGCMEKRSLIHRTPSSTEGFARLAGILEGEKFECRSADSRRAFGVEP